MSATIDPQEYAAVHGPRAGDRVRLGDTGLVVRVESDSQAPGTSSWPASARPPATDCT